MEKLTESQSFFDADYKYRITLKYKSNITRSRDEADEDMRHLRNRIHRKLFGRRPWCLDWFPSIETRNKYGQPVRTHIHLYVGENKRYWQFRDLNSLAYIIRQEWEAMKQSLKSNKKEIRSYIEVIDREKSIGYGTKTFGDERYIRLQEALKDKEIQIQKTDRKLRSNLLAEKQDIQKEITKLRAVDLFDCVSNNFYMKEAVAN